MLSGNEQYLAPGDSPEGASLSGSAELAARAQNSFLSATCSQLPAQPCGAALGSCAPRKATDPRSGWAPRGLPVTSSSHVASQVVPLF